MNDQRRQAAIEAGARALFKDYVDQRWEPLIDGPAPSWDDEAPEEARDVYRHRAATVIDAAAPHLVVHVHHHDVEKRAEHFNEGYEAAMAQHLADDPSAADDWLAVEKAKAWDEGRRAEAQHCARQEDANAAGQGHLVPDPKNPYALGDVR